MDEFGIERYEINASHARHKKEMLDIIATMEAEFNEAEGDARNAGLIVPIIRTCLATTPRCMRSREASPVAERGSQPLCERESTASKRQSRVALWRRLRPGPVDARRATAGTRESGERVCARTCCGERARAGAGSRRDVSEKSSPPTENLKKVSLSAHRDERKLRVTDRRYVFGFLTLRSHRSLFDKNPEVAAESPTCAVLELASGKAARHRSKRRGGDLGRRAPFFASPDAFATARDAGDARVEALLVSERCLGAARGSATPPAVVTPFKAEVPFRQPCATPPPPPPPPPPRPCAAFAGRARARRTAATRS